MLNLIVAHCRNRGIGMHNKLPWKLKSDMERFKKLTVGDGNNAVIMGRKTWESLPEKYRPLPNRTNIILSNTIKDLDNVVIFGSSSEARKYCLDNKFTETWIIGGSKVYSEFLKTCDLSNIYITEIYQNYNCDAYFPELPMNYTCVEHHNWLREGGVVYGFKLYKNNVLPGDFLRDVFPFK